LEKKVKKNPKEKIFMSSQTFFNLTNNIKIIQVINYFRKKGTTMSILNLKVNFIILFQNMLSVFHQKLTVRFLCTSKSFKKYIIYINKINSGHLDLRVLRQLETNLFVIKFLITNNEFWKKNVQKNPKEKIFMSSQTFFNLTNKTVINYFRKKGTTMSILNLWVNLGLG